MNRTSCLLYTFCLVLVSCGLCVARPAIVQGCDPFGDVTLHIDNINAAWGVGNWDQYDFDTPLATVLSAEAIYVEGSYPCFSTFLTWFDSNWAALSDYVDKGGRLLVNCATDGSFCYGNGLCSPYYFGGIRYCHAGSDVFPFYSGPLATQSVFIGPGTFTCAHNYFEAHEYDTLMEGPGVAILIGRPQGLGVIMYGGLTPTYYWAPNPHAHHFQSNLCTYLYNGIPHSVSVHASATSVALNAPVTISFSYSGNSAVTARVDYDGDYVSDDSLSVAGPGTYAFPPHSFDAVGTKVITVCVDDGQGSDSCANYAAKKRYGTSNSVTVAVILTGGGDPYFLGFDGVVFKFEGTNSYWYNLLTSHDFQLNTLLNIGIAESNGPYQFRQFMYSASIQTPDYILRFDVSTKGTVACWILPTGRTKKVDFPLDREVSLEVGGSLLFWQNEANFTRNALNMSPHPVHQTLRVQTTQLDLTIMAVELLFRKEKFHFLDMDLALRDESVSFSSPDSLKKGKVQCMDGVWGRTSCQSSMTPVDASLYELGTNGCFSNDFPRNLFVSSV